MTFLFHYILFMLFSILGFLILLNFWPLVAYYININILVTLFLFIFLILN
jgi:hypothetical protein